MRAVVDTNILVSALIRPQGAVGPMIVHLRRGDYTLLYNDATLEELVDVLNRPRIREKYGLNDADIRAVVALILLRGEFVVPEVTIRACRDPHDDKFLTVAVNGHADVIVSGDDDLRVLSPFQGIPVVSPRDFLEMLTSKGRRPDPG